MLRLQFRVCSHLKYSRSYSETPPAAAHGGYSRTPPTSSLMTMMPPPPLHHHHAMPPAHLAAPEVAGWGSGGYKMRGGHYHHHPTHNRLQPISRGPLPAMRTPPQPMHQDIFSAMGKWTNEYVFPTTTESIPNEMRV